jgi:hypothetical protein
MLIDVKLAGVMTVILKVVSVACTDEIILASVMAVITSTMCLW